MMVRRRRARSALRIAIWSGVSLALVVGCSLDTRHLTSDATSAQAGSDSPPAMNAGAGTSSAGAHVALEAGADGTNEAGANPGTPTGSAGAAPVPLPLIDGCTDLDGDGVGDCQENLLDNGDFETGVHGWTPDADSTIVWDDQNAAGDTPSGCALLSATGPASAGATGSVLRVAKQCLPIAGKQLVTAYANALVGSDQDPAGHAEVDVYFFDAAACAGTYTTSFSTPQPLDASQDEWLSLKAGSVSGPNTQSVLVTLTLSQPLSATTFAARFDNVLLKTQTP